MLGGVGCGVCVCCVGGGWGCLLWYPNNIITLVPVKGPWIIWAGISHGSVKTYIIWPINETTVLGKRVHILRGIWYMALCNTAYVIIQSSLSIPTCITARASRTCRDACRESRFPVLIKLISYAYTVSDSPISTDDSICMHTYVKLCFTLFITFQRNELTMIVTENDKVIAAVGGFQKPYRNASFYKSPTAL